MMYAYGVTMQGAYHIREGVVCQDAHKIMKCSDNMAIAAVADGLGSEKYSDIASKIAVDTVVNYCAEHIYETDGDDIILEQIRESFVLSQEMIEGRAAEDGNEIDEYDTTLSLAVILGDTLYYGHSGDSGIIAMTTDGAFHEVTRQQRDAEGRVYPLFFSGYWEFAKYGLPVKSVLLATDGMLESFFPIYIRNARVNIHAALVRRLMAPDSLHFEEKGEAAVEQEMQDYLAAIPGNVVNDDKTVAVVVNDEIPFTMQPEEYYSEPEWNALRRDFQSEWRKKAYPGLFEREDPAGKKEDAEVRSEAGLENFDICI